MWQCILLYLFLLWFQFYNCILGANIFSVEWSNYLSVVKTADTMNLSWRNGVVWLSVGMC